MCVRVHVCGGVRAYVCACVNSITVSSVSRVQIPANSVSFSNILGKIYPSSSNYRLNNPSSFYHGLQLIQGKKKTMISNMWKAVWSLRSTLFTIIQSSVLRESMTTSMKGLTIIIKLFVWLVLRFGRPSPTDIDKECLCIVWLCMCLCDFPQFSNYQFSCVCFHLLNSI